uniref:Uncharacterized protein n=1 Tax=Parascaris equorum TaxID=6256 RepID=A0A914R427_PAREQ
MTKTTVHRGVPHRSSSQPVESSKRVHAAQEVVRNGDARYVEHVDDQSVVNVCAHFWTVCNYALRQIGFFDLIA